MNTARTVEITTRHQNTSIVSVAYKISISPHSSGVFRKTGTGHEGERVLPILPGDLPDSVK